MTKKPFKTDGFTLIELMLVVAIIGLLAAIAIPKFANLVVKAKESAIKGKMGSLRSALSIYYADNDGTNVLDPNRLTIGSRYLDGIPRISIPTTTDHTVSYPIIGGVQSDANFGNAVPSTGGPWYFFIASGRLVVNCTHTDSQGTTWSLW